MAWLGEVGVVFIKLMGLFTLAIGVEFLTKVWGRSTSTCAMGRWRHWGRARVEAQISANAVGTGKATEGHSVQPLAEQESPTR